ncbi:gamma-glutamyltransferase family protein [Terricaulis sp.]|uniref:gamma-glutamyltransferase family protein n=1 Tax=Terricaulis sp. TaxID=2768686 RepID=UPI002AC66851|nr:gamma-glutamyltransferase family protein [Terricaulis sp.]MDZ4692188.1 gamma-glutamyltransferase family protein [Terricaulis sp.]
MRNGMRALAGAMLGWAMLSSASAQDAPPRDPNFGRGERVSGQTFATRSPVIAPHGAAATAHPLATQTAIDVLRNGGTAIDAAIAANAMLGLVEPTGNGIGGDIFVIVWDPRTQRLYGYNGSGRTPRGMSLAEMRREARRRGNPDAVPSFGAASVSVPGTVDGWFALHERFGRTPMADLLAPTIRYAREGAPIPQTIAMYWANNERRLEAEFAAGRLQEIDNARRTYFRDCEDISANGYDRQGRPVYLQQCERRIPDGHSLFANPDLANTLEQIATGGRDAYYRGPIARTIDAYMRRIGGWLRYDDLARHQGEWVDPICADYRDVEVCELPPNSQGVVALQTLRILEAYNLREMGFLSADSLHTQIEATRLAFADRAQFYGDPAFTGFDTRRLLTDEYTAQRRAMISNERAMPPPPHAELRIDGDTTYLTTADSDGMMVSLIQSNYRGMGSGLVPDRLGFMLQDRAELFSLESGHPNVYAPGRRPFQTIIPAFALRNGQPWLAFGVMGGDMQPQAHVQIIVNLVDYDMDLQAAGDAARYRFYGGAEPTGDEPDGVGFVAMENGVPPSVRAELERRGHRIRPADGSFGGYQAIMRNENGIYEAATEMRKDGSAGGY